ncbi:MAG: T9SS type A sorting domain-containing protein [Candidatus Stahlbacteria bacterium]|nr:T9SS type A sorting domain-containing protein [Candidatus Stahlbacteria bacterium]
MLETIIVKHDTLVFVEDSQFVVDVMTQSSLPVKDALVCIMKDGELYAHQITGTNGRITFKLTLATPGIIYVTVTAHNYLPYEDSAVVENIGCEENAKCKVQNAKLEVYPNPSIRSAVIGYQLAIKGRVSLSLYDITGRLIKPFVDEDKEAGYYTVNWDTKDVSSGVYFIKLETVGYKVTKKLTILK